MLIVDFSHSGSFLLPKSFARAGFPSSLFGRTCCEPFLFVLDYTLSGSLLPLQSLAQLGPLLSILDLAKLESLPSPQSLVCLGIPLATFGAVRLGLPALVLDFQVNL